MADYTATDLNTKGFEYSDNGRPYLRVFQRDVITSSDFVELEGSRKQVFQPEGLENPISFKKIACWNKLASDLNAQLEKGVPVDISNASLRFQKEADYTRNDGSVETNNVRLILKDDNEIVFEGKGKNRIAKVQSTRTRNEVDPSGRTTGQ